jgi:uncharacterized protein (TIGR00297 family)
MIPPDIVTRTIAGLALSVVIAATARSREALSTGGSIAAVVVATATAAAGWTWAATLIAFFLASTLLSRAGGRSKRERTEDIVAKAGARDAWQVIANGGPFAAIAVASILWPSAGWTIPGAGAIAASNADTWATEIGTMSRRLPRSIITFREVAPGTSGGVTSPGTLGSLAGAAFIALIVSLGGWPVQSAWAALIGGISGSFVDSIIGATVQEKRWCASCGRGTERAVHTCGTSTTVVGGVGWIRNDAVNFISSIAGALIGILWLL